jgi:hypothetical protein
MTELGAVRKEFLDLVAFKPVVPCIHHFRVLLSTSVCKDRTILSQTTALENSSNVFRRSVHEHFTAKNWEGATRKSEAGHFDTLGFILKLKLVGRVRVKV